MDEIQHAEFETANFDPKVSRRASPKDFLTQELVQRYRKRIPLPQLQKCLLAHHAATRQELVELILGPNLRRFVTAEDQ